MNKKTRIFVLSAISAVALSSGLMPMVSNKGNIHVPGVIADSTTITSSHPITSLLNRSLIDRS